MRRFIKAAILLGCTAIAGAAQAAPAARIELNTLEQRDSACRMTFTAQSEAGAQSLVTQTVLFDTGGAVRLLTLFDFGQLPAGAPRVRQFDLADLPCGDIGTLLFNGVETCLQADGAACAEPPEFGSRIEVEVQG